MSESKALDSDHIHEAEQEPFDSLVIPTPEMVKQHFSRGQCLASDDEVEYLKADQVAPDSKVETFAAGEVNFRKGPVAGVPIYFRTGKKTKDKASRIDIILYHTNSLYGNAYPSDISIIIDPRSKILFTINGKKITTEGLRRENLSYKFSKEEMAQAPDGYERLFHDVFVTDRISFTYWPELKQYWKFADAVETAWQDENKDTKQLEQYPSGKFGTESSSHISEKDTEHWTYR